MVAASCVVSPTLPSSKMADTKKTIRSHLESMLGLLEKLDVDNEADLERRYLRDMPHRVIHLKNNPMDTEIRRKEDKFSELEKENERLRARLELLEAGNMSDVTRRVDDAINSAGQIEALSRKVEELKRREAKILDSFRRTSREYREVCYLLTGYKMDALKDRIYVLSNMYAERESDKLCFEISRDGELQLLQNEYSEGLTSFIRTYLEEANSFPAFTAALTMSLFNSTTQQQSHDSSVNETDLSVTMSTTVREA